MTDPTLRIDIKSIDKATIVIPLGDIDMSNSMHLRSTLRPLLQEDPSKIILDLHAVPYMDSSGLGTLIEAVQLSNQAAIAFLLCNVTESVQSIITLSKLDLIFNIHNSREDALAE